LTNNFISPLAVPSKLAIELPVADKDVSPLISPTLAVHPHWLWAAVMPEISAKCLADMRIEPGVSLVPVEIERRDQYGYSDEY